MAIHKLTGAFGQKVLASFLLTLGVLMRRTLRKQILYVFLLIMLMDGQTMPV